MRRKKLSSKQSRKNWNRGNKMNKVNLGVYSNRNRGGVRF